LTDQKVISNQASMLRLANILALVTIFYNIAEGIVSVAFGYSDDTLSLFGFGVDSFVEVSSGIGIWHMLHRLRMNGNENRDEFEKTALKITGTGFYILAAGLIVSSVYNFITNHKPDTTFWGIVISAISIVTMSVLIKYKLKVGKELNSAALIADANCTKTCLYLSVALLASSIGFELTGFGGIDSIGALAIAYFSFNEGKEAFEKVKTGKHCGCENDSCSN
jgi:divalent metal cation (Fe/Co/Zn/Cd) transporter